MHRNFTFNYTKTIKNLTQSKYTLNKQTNIRLAVSNKNIFKLNQCYHGENTGTFDCILRHMANFASIFPLPPPHTTRVINRVLKM